MAFSLVLALFLSATTGMMRQDSVGTATGPSEGFSFVLTYGLDGDVLDTDRGTLTREVLYPTRRIVNADLRLTPQELGQIEKSLAEINYWDMGMYPTSFRPQRDDGISMSTEPSPKYVLSVSLRGLSKQVTWHDANMSTISTAANLRKVLRMIIAMIEASPEYGKLPPSGKAHF
jgi:hypothetical protein